MLGRSMEQVDLSPCLSLLGLDRLVLLDGLDMLVALQRANRVFGEINTATDGAVLVRGMLVRAHAVSRCNIRETLDQVIRVADLASLVLSMLLCAISRVSLTVGAQDRITACGVDLTRRSAPGTNRPCSEPAKSMSDTAGSLRARPVPMAPEMVKTYNVGRHVD